MDQGEGLPLNNCGKIIVAQDESLDAQIDLYKRANENGVFTQIIDAKQIKKLSQRLN